MAFSYSFHLSNKGNSVSTIQKVGQVSRHNLRGYSDQDKIEILEGNYDSILDEFKRIYHEEFDECLERYNSTKRADRKIDDYLEHVSNSRSDVGAEIIIQIGDKDFWENIPSWQWSSMTDVFQDQLKELKELCPDFKIASATVHYDEKSPHMHVVGVPVHEGYQKGMEKQVAKTKVFTKESLEMLQNKMRESMEKSMERVPSFFEGMKIKEKEQGRNKDIPKESLAEYYEIQKTIAERDLIQEQVRNLERAEKEKSERLKKLDNEIKSKETEVARITTDYDFISKRVEGSKTPKIQLKTEKVIDEPKTVFKEEISHKEYFVKIPCKSEEEVKARGQEIKALYTKKYTKESFDSLYGKFNAFIKGKFDELGSLRAESDKIIAERDEILLRANKQAESIVNNAMVDHAAELGLFDKLAKENPQALMNSSVASNLVQDTIMDTCKQLESLGKLKGSSMDAFISVDKKPILAKLKEVDFIAKCKENLLKITQSISHHRSR